MRSLFVSPTSAERGGLGRGLVPGCPSGFSEETIGSPTFLGNPLCSCPALGPRRDLLGQSSLPFEVLPSASQTTSAPALSTFSGLYYTACSLAVYASQGGLLHLHARLASGCGLCFAGRASRYPRAPLGSYTKFQFTFFLFVQAFVAQLSAVLGDGVKKLTFPPLIRRHSRERESYLLNTRPQPAFSGSMGCRGRLSSPIPRNRAQRESRRLTLPMPCLLEGGTCRSAHHHHHPCITDCLVWRLAWPLC